MFSLALIAASTLRKCVRSHFDSHEIHKPQQADVGFGENKLQTFPLKTLSRDDRSAWTLQNYYHDFLKYF